MSVIPLSPLVLMRYANRLYEPGLTSKYNNYTLERTRMGRCADENGPAKAA